MHVLLFSVLLSNLQEVAMCYLCMVWRKVPYDLFNLFEMSRLETEYQRLETQEDDNVDEHDVMLHVPDSGRGKQ